MDIVDFNHLYASGAVVTTIEAGDSFLVARPNPQVGGGYSLFAIEESDLVSQIISQVPTPTPFTLPYDVYTALLTQTGTSAPVATVLQNTLGATPIWSYDGFAGGNRCTLTGKFVVGKTVIFVGNNIGTEFTAVAFSLTVNDFLLFVSDAVGGVNIGNGANGILDGTPIEIRVYK